MDHFFDPVDQSNAKASFGLSRKLGFYSPYPRPTNGILVAMMVMNCTFASSGRLAM